jgi:hypothetical protein
MRAMSAAGRTMCPRSPAGPADRSGAVRSRGEAGAEAQQAIRVTTRGFGSMWTAQTAWSVAAMELTR